METIGNDRAAFFVGRDNFILELHETLQSNRLVAINGPSGVGKTELALEYAYRFAQDYQWILRLNLRTVETWLADSLELIAQLALPLALEEQNLANINRILGDWFSHHQNYLLILDNVGSIALPSTTEQATGHVLVLTRNCSHSSSITCMDLKKLDAQEGAFLLLRRTGQLSGNASLEQAPEALRLSAETLAREMDGLPLALYLGGAYSCAIDSTIPDYLETYRGYMEQLAQNNVAKDRATDAIAITSSLPVIHLQKSQPIAAELLWVCTVLAPTDIPQELFTLGVSELEPILHELARTPTLLAEVLTQLCALGFLVARGTNGALCMQPTVQGTLCHAQTLEKQQTLVEQVLRAFSHLLPAQTQMTPAARMRLVAHVLHLVTLSSDWTLAHTSIADVFSWAASLLWEQELIQDAEMLLRKVLLIWERVPGTEHPNLDVLLQNLATLNTLLKNYSEAEALANRAVLTTATAFGATHPKVLLSLNKLGHIYSEQEKKQEALQCYQKAISFGERGQHQTHPFCLASMYDLAVMYTEQAQFDDAEPLLQQVCAAWDHDPGPKDPSTVHAWRILAQVAAYRQEWQQAEACYQHILPIYEKKLGKDHEETLRCIVQEANVLLAQDKFEAAEADLRRVLDLRERNLGTEHPDVAECLHGLAKIALAHNQISEAFALVKRAREIYENHAGTRNLVFATVLETLANVYVAQEEYTQALLVLEKALDLKKHILGEEHLDLVKNLIDLAALYFTLEQFEKAETLLLHALAIYQNAQKPEDLLIDPVLTGLASIATSRKRYSMAEMFLDRSRAIRRLALGENDPTVADILQMQGMVASAQEQWEKAELLYQQALSIYENTLGKEHPRTVECLWLIATLSVSQGQFADKQDLFRGVLAREEKWNTRGNLAPSVLVIARPEIGLTASDFVLLASASEQAHPRAEASTLEFVLALVLVLVPALVLALELVLDAPVCLARKIARAGWPLLFPSSQPCRFLGFL